MRTHVSLLLALAVAPVLALAAERAPKPASSETPPVIAAEADRMLKQMTDYLASLQSFRVRSSAVDELVTTTGQKIQIITESAVSVNRPNRLRSEQVGGSAGLSYLYDGKTMTLYCKANNTFGTVPAPPTLDATIDMARKQYQIEAPGADLLYSHPYDILTEQVKGGQFIGREIVADSPANHIAFTGDEVDWQIWIQDGRNLSHFGS